MHNNSTIPVDNDGVYHSGGVGAEILIGVFLALIAISLYLVNRCLEGGCYVSTTPSAADLAFAAGALFGVGPNPGPVVPEDPDDDVVVVLGGEV